MLTEKELCALEELAADDVGAGAAETLALVADVRCLRTEADGWRSACESVESTLGDVMASRDELLARVEQLTADLVRAVGP